MFFLSLPLSKTECTLDQAKGNVADVSTLPNPELYIIVNGRPMKNNAVWHTLVDANQVKHTLTK